MIYVASLYSNGAASDSPLDLNVRQGRVDYVMKRMQEFIKDRKFVYSPIMHWHEMSLQYNLPKDYGFWQNTDRHFITKCDKVYVLKMTDEFGDWAFSKGVMDEIDFALVNNIEIVYIDCDDYS